MKVKIKALCQRILLPLIWLAAVAATASARDFVLVLDPGHGGKDYGATGKITNEKTVNLDVAKLVGKKIAEKFDDVKVVYTRQSDKFVSLKDRAELANKAGGDLFVSIHVNSVDKRNKKRTTINGASVYTLGLHKSADNLAVARRENSVMALEDDFTATYEGFDPESTESYIIFELSQNKHMEQSVDLAQKLQNEFIKTARRADRGVRQAGFWVLWATGMPSVLIELDFICNPAVEKFLASKAGKEKMSDAIVNAFAQYKKSAGVGISESVESGDDEPDDVVLYKVQILTSTKLLGEGDNELKGLRSVKYYKDGNLYKYTVGAVRTASEADRIREDVARKFPAAFIIKTLGGKRIK